MKRLLPIAVLLAFLCGCSATPAGPVSPSLAPDYTEAMRIPENLAALIPDIAPEYTTTYSHWINLEGHFTSKDNTETVSFCLLGGASEAADTPLYYMFLDTGKEVLVKDFAEQEGTAIEAVRFCDLTGDGLDEIIVTLNEMRTLTFYVLTASQNNPRVIFTNSYYNSPLPDYPPALGFSGTCDSGFQAVIRNDCAGTEETLDLSALRGKQDENASYDDGEFSFDFLIKDSLEFDSLRFIDKGNGLYELKHTGEIQLTYSGGQAYLKESFAFAHVYFSYDAQKDTLVITETEIELFEEYKQQN